MSTSADHLILRGLHLMIRATFSPNEPVAQAKHFASLQSDIGPWLTDYADEIAKPVVDFTLAPFEQPPGGQGGLQQ